MAFTIEEKRWFERAMSTFDKLPKPVRDALRNTTMHRRIRKAIKRRLPLLLANFLGLAIALYLFRR